MLKILKTPYVTLLAFFVSFVWFLNFSNAVLPVHFIKSGLSFSQIAFGTLLGMAGQVITVLLLSKIQLKNHVAWWIALAIYSINFSLYVLVPHSTIFFIASFFGGIASILFYAFYNVSHFELTPRDKTGLGAAVFFNTLTIISIIAPVYAGLVASFSISILLFCSILFALIPFALSFKQTSITINYSLKKALDEVRSVRLILILSGVYDAIGYGVIPLVTLTLISDPLEFGSFKTFLTLITVITGFALGKWSDKLKSKNKLLMALAGIVGFITLLFAIPLATSSIFWWASVNILLGMFSPLYSQTALSFVMDSTHDRIHAIFGREFLINIGRFIGMGIVLIGFIYPTLLPLTIIILAISIIYIGVIVGKNI